jgi:hypothetical protein
MTYGIVLLLDEETNRKAIALSRGYRQSARYPDFILGENANVPHLSMIHLELESDGVRKAASRLEPMAADHLVHAAGRKVAGTFDTVSASKPDSPWVFWNTSRTAELIDLHATVVEAAAPLRSGAVSISWPMDLEQERMHVRYGYPSVMRCFQPHVTLGLLRDDAVPVFTEIVTHPWTATALVLARIGAHGAVTEVLERYPL